MNINEFSASIKCSSLFLFFPVVFCVSCSSSPRHHIADAGNEYKETIQRKPPSSFSDTVIIDFPAVVFYNPDTIQFKKIKAITDSMTFGSNVHDYFYQMRNSRLVLKKQYPGIKIIEVKNSRYLLFKYKNGEKEYVDLDLKNEPCGMFVFDGQKASRLVDMPNVETDLGFYFSNRRE